MQYKWTSRQNSAGIIRSTVTLAHQDNKSGGIYNQSISIKVLKVDFILFYFYVVQVISGWYQNIDHLLKTSYESTIVSHC